MYKPRGHETNARRRSLVIRYRLPQEEAYRTLPGVNICCGLFGLIRSTRGGLDEALLQIVGFRSVVRALRGTSGKDQRVPGMRAGFTPKTCPSAESAERTSTSYV